MSQVLFLLIAAVGLVAALGTVLARNLVHAALFLVAFFFIVSCQFVLLEAEFLAAIQVLIYIGAVAILLMFGIMLTRNIQGDDTTSVGRVWVWPAMAATVALFTVLVFGVNNHVGLKGRGDWSNTVRRPLAVSGPRAEVINDMGRAVGVQMLTRYSLAFEVAGLLLTAGMVGAIALAHRETSDERVEPPGARTSDHNTQDATATAGTVTTTGAGTA